MRTAEEYRELAARISQVRLSDSDNGCRVFATDKVVALLREAATLREWMQLIYDFDDGAWAAGKHHNEARKQGIVTMRGMAGAALRGESILGGEPHD